MRRRRTTFKRSASRYVHRPLLAAVSVGRRHGLVAQEAVDFVQPSVELSGDGGRDVQAPDALFAFDAAAQRAEVPGQFVEQRGENRFTTADIARDMGVDEYPVRAAVSWLARYGLIEIIPGVRSKRYLEQPAARRLHGDSYSVSVYQIKEKGAQADFAALNRAFGFA